MVKSTNIFILNAFFVGLISAQLNNDNIEKKYYGLKNMPIDVIIPCDKKDILTLDLAIGGIRENIKNLNRIIVISKDRLSDRAEWFDEQKFPFTKETVAFELFQNQGRAQSVLLNPKNRIGWLYQQLLKLYSYLIIPEISENILIVDADTIILKPINFLKEDGSGIFSLGTENHLPYFEHMEILIPGLKKQISKYSGISHLMLFQKPILDDLFNTIKKIHGCEVWEAICRTVDYNKDGSFVSEYEIYFNFALSRSNQFGMKEMKRDNSGNLGDLDRYKKEDYDYVSFHSWMR